MPKYPPLLKTDPVAISSDKVATGAIIYFIWWLTVTAHQLHTGIGYEHPLDSAKTKLALTLETPINERVPSLASTTTPQGQQHKQRSTQSGWLPTNPFKEAGAFRLFDHFEAFVLMCFLGACSSSIFPAFLLSLFQVAIPSMSLQSYLHGFANFS